MNFGNRSTRSTRICPTTFLPNSVRFNAIKKNQWDLWDLCEPEEAKVRRASVRFNIRRANSVRSVRSVWALKNSEICVRLSHTRAHKKKHGCKIEPCFFIYIMCGLFFLFGSHFGVSLVELFHHVACHVVFWVDVESGGLVKNHIVAFLLSVFL